MAHSHARDAANAVRTILTHLATKFVRARKNGPRQCLLILLTIIHSGVNRIGVKPARLMVMDRFDRMIDWGPGKEPSASSICRALKKLLPNHLEAVITIGLSEVTQGYGTGLMVHGRRLIAVDGVRINAQRTSALARWLRLPRLGGKKRAHQPQALVVVARCVVTGVVLAEEIVPHDGSERACARKMAARLAVLGRIIVLMDRGFPARDLIGALREYRIDFVVRMCGGKRTWRELAGLVTTKARGKSKAKDALLPIRLRGIDNRWEWCDLRAILTPPVKRGRPRCDRTPQRMLLLTSLRGVAWNTQRIISLYHRRWDIETSFREDKRLLGATKSHAKTKDGFIVELLALQIYRILMALLAAVVVQQLGKRAVCWHNPTRTRISTPQLIVGAWMLILDCITRWHDAVFRIARWAREIARDADKCRPNRSFKRKCKGVEGVWKMKRDRCYG
jgi:hypothetical protein